MEEYFKRIRLTVVTELTVDSRNYPDPSDETIIKTELRQWPEWITDVGDIKSEKIKILSDITDESLVAEQQEFIEWLKSKEMYNPMDSGYMMIKMFNVWKVMKNE